MHGSWQLVQALHRAGLVDVYRLLQYPVVVGTGKRLFPDGTTPATFATVGGLAGAARWRRLADPAPASFGVISAGAYTVTEGRSATVLD